MRNFLIPITMCSSVFDLALSPKGVQFEIQTNSYTSISTSVTNSIHQIRLFFAVFLISILLFEPFIWPNHLILKNLGGCKCDLKQIGNNTHWIMNWWWMHIIYKYHLQSH
jgi:hypothetical protein